MCLGLGFLRRSGLRDAGGGDSGLRTGLRRSDVVDAEFSRGLDEATVEGCETIASGGLREMESVREVHAAVHPVERLGDEGRVFQCDAWQAGECTQGPGELVRGIGVDAAKHPFSVSSKTVVLTNMSLPSIRR